MSFSSEKAARGLDPRLEVTVALGRVIERAGPAFDAAAALKRAEELGLRACERWAKYTALDLVTDK